MRISKNTFICFALFMVEVVTNACLIIVISLFVFVVLFIIAQNLKNKQTKNNLKLILLMSL